MRKRALKLIMASFAVIVLLACLKADTTTVQAATKRISGGSSMKKAKKVSKGNAYIVKGKDERSFWYKFKTPNYSTYFSYYAKNLGDDKNSEYEFFLYSKDERQLLRTYTLHENEEDEDSYSVPLKKNTWYYIKLNFWTGDGNLKFYFGLNRDDVPNSMKKAHTIKCDKKYINSIDVKYDVDWFKFKPKKSGTYTFTLDNIGSHYCMNGAVVSKSGKELESSLWIYRTSSGPAGCGHDSFTVELKKNRYYYIKIASQSPGRAGKYKFSIKYGFQE